MIVLRTLLENNLSQNRALIAEHGLSFMVETEDVKILFFLCFQTIIYLLLCQQYFPLS